MPNKIEEGGQALIKCLEREGVEYIFGYSGGAAIPIFDALVTTEITLSLSWFVMSRVQCIWRMATRVRRVSRQLFW